MGFFDIFSKIMRVFHNFNMVAPQKSQYLELGGNKRTCNGDMSNYVLLMTGMNKMVDIVFAIFKPIVIMLV